MPGFTTIPLNQIAQFQSGYLYAQAAGSNGSDNSAPGTHLRWAFSRELGDMHIPKGNIASDPSSAYYATNAYNKADDFVVVYRAEYNPGNPNKIFPATANLLTDTPTLIETGPTREWRYLTSPVPSVSTLVIVRFADVLQYNTIRATINPTNATTRENFIKAYTGMLEVETPGKLFFAATIGVKAPQAVDYIKIESVSTPDKFVPGDKIISCRKTIYGNTMLPYPQGAGVAKKAARVICENIKYVRFIYSSGAYPTIVNIETYEDFIRGANQGNGKWELVGNFSLSLDDNFVYRKLENLVTDVLDPIFISTYPIDKRWPKFNDVDLFSGAFTVKIQNYKDRWIANPPDQEDLKTAVTEYLLKSKILGNEKANATLPSQTSGDSAQFSMSYLNMINMVGLDFHVARMLGLGHIDNPREGTNKTYVHVAQYYTFKKPLDYPTTEPQPPFGVALNHLFMTLPTARTDFRLPPAPVQEPLSYGLFDTSSVPPVVLTSSDGQGYSLFDDSRFIDINKAPFDLEVPFGTFFNKDILFSLCDVTRPILFGVEYRKQGETDFRKPELSNDPNFLDYTSRPETVPILEQPNPIFVHQEKEEGFHDYAIYGINWFSRPSTISNIQPTNETLFPKKNTLVPPINFGVQLIQPENPLIFTTAVEQTKLQALTTIDKTLVRLTFDWNNVHNNSYKYATYAEFFFRENAPTNVRGELVAVSNPNSLHEITVTTQTTTITTVNGTETIQPNILPAEINKYLNGLLATEDGQSFVISTINTPVNGNNPTFTLKQIRKTQSTPVPNTSNQFSTAQLYISPTAGLRFMVVENLAEETNWTSLLKKRVGLVHYSTADSMKIANSTQNDGKYAVNSVALAGTDTNIFVKEIIPGSTANGNMEFAKTVSIISVDVSNRIFKVKGNVLAELSLSNSINVLLSEIGDGSYTVSSLNPVGADTEIGVVENIPAGTSFGNVIFTKTVPVTTVDQTNKIFTITGDVTGELIPSHKETFINADGSTVEYNQGGVFEKATVKEFFDVDQTHLEPDPDSQTTAPNIGIPNSRTGIFKITFQSYTLENHPDPEIEWYKGFVRIIDSNSLNPEIKTLQVLEIKKDINGNILSPLQLIAYDSAFDVDINYNPKPSYVPILTGNNVDVNFHPSYRLYVLADNNINPITGGTNNFDAATMLPAPGGNTKQTFMAAWSIDTTTIDPNPSPHPYQSYINTPVVLLAREIVIPEPPEEPVGPLFATRPDFYAKSTYTIDTKVKTMVNGNPRKPYALMFFRANEKRILSVLYKDATVAQIITDIAALQSPDTDFFNNRWKDLANGIFDNASGQFKDYIPGGYRFPLPDNDKTDVVNPSTITGDIVKPFATTFTDLNSLFLGETIITWVKRVLDSAFLPLTEQPVIFQFIKEGVQTSGKKPKTRTANGEVIPPPNFEQFPMAVKYAKLPNGNISILPTDVDNANNEIFVRLTDFTIDGAAKNIYFYYAVEMSNNFEISQRSSIMGPVQLVNAFPAETPEIKKVFTQLSNTLLGIPTAVKFELNDYIESENIKKVQIYRATNQPDSLTVRTMKLAKEVDFNTQIDDNFSDVSLPPYGDPLFYRIVALRQIKNEQAQTEFVPSKPSNVVLTNIVDNINPPAPQISYTSDPPTGSPMQLNTVVLSWPKTAHNATYHLYMMNAAGNWVKIYTIKTNDLIVTVPLLSTELASGTLFKQDADLTTIYTRFRVQVVNSSGLLNIEQKELTI